MLVSSYNGGFVVFSLIVAILAAYTALNMVGRVSSSKGRAATLWLIGGSFAMGFGIWSMHFIGMLAFSLPISLGYDVTLTVLSLVIAIFSSAFALWLVCQENLPSARLWLGGLLMGFGIAAMHYTGMAAMSMTPGIVYIPWLFVLSIVIAASASWASLWIAFRLRTDSEVNTYARIGASLVMGCAIVGMHYTGMAAAQFPVGSFCGAANSGIDTQWLALLVIVVSLAVFAIALIISTLDVRTNLLVNSLDRAHSDLLQLALHDNLTKLPNRILLNDRLEQAINKSSRKMHPFAVLFMDLDGFKAVNDLYGHHTGDSLLMKVSQRILDTKRAGDTVARLGGDEFVLLIEPSALEDTAALAQRLVEGIGKPYSIDGNNLNLSASIGIALFPEDGKTAHELMVNADAAMYHAKETGRNGYCFFESTMNTNAHHQMQLQQDLRQALERQEFVLHYQPKILAPDDQIVGVEALLRWQSSEHGLLQPDVFLALAERTGLIIPIGNWVIDEACRQLRAWQDKGHNNWSMAVNLSTIQLGHASLVDVVQAALVRHAVDARHLVLEVTESTAMRDSEVSLEVLNRLSALGVGISIDDFGRGYSSLLYLKRLPANELKIDRGFVAELAQGNNDSAIVSAIIALGQTLGMKIVAEGVETVEQKSLLTRLGCTTLQGYYMGKPQPAELLYASFGVSTLALS